MIRGKKIDYAPWNREIYVMKKLSLLIVTGSETQRRMLPMLLLATLGTAPVDEGGACSPHRRCESRKDRSMPRIIP